MSSYPYCAWYTMMAVTYCKRFRMEIGISDELPEAELPEGYSWVPWSDSLLGAHAEVKYLSFHREFDSQVFPCLGDRFGCLRLMRDIARREGFVPEATWLIGCGSDFIATIQGVRAVDGAGSIQNVGVVTEHRRKSLGRALLLKALHGFVARGIGRARLEVTAENQHAVNLYESVGFLRAKTLYKAIDC